MAGQQRIRRGEPPDSAVSDIEIADIGGLDLLAKVKQRKPRFQG
jgi:CheY-like chemotaxis protein